MPRESVADKATRLFQAAAVVYVGTMDDGPPPVYEFTVAGDNGTHAVLASGPGDVSCDCPAKAGCAHAGAVALWLEDADARQGTLIDTVEVVEDQAPPTSTETSVDAPGARPGIVLAEPTPRALQDLAEAPVTWRTLETLANTEFVPAALRGRPAAVLGSVLLGRDYGLGPLEALRLIDVIDGSPEPNAELKLRMYYRAGHRLEVVEHTDQVCTVKGTRQDGGSELTVTFTLEDATRMGLTGKSNWKKEPADMLWARAVSRLVRRLAPDALDRA